MLTCTFNYLFLYIKPEKLLVSYIAPPASPPPKKKCLKILSAKNVSVWLFLANSVVPSKIVMCWI